MNNSKTTRAALYARVSTNHQDHALQLDALRQMAEQRGWTVTEYIDQASGSGAKLPARDVMMSDARSGKIDVVAAWRFDRFARSTKDLLNALDSFQSWGVQFVSLQEGIDTTTPMGRMVFTIIGALAEFEKNLIRERVVAGLQSAKKRGKVLGRPKVPIDIQEAIKLRESGHGWRTVAKLIGVKPTTLRRAVGGAET